MKEVQARFRHCKLELNESKTKIVYCKDSNRNLKYEEISFDFLGYTFRPRGACTRLGELSFSLLGKKKIQKVQIQTNPFLSETGKDSQGKSNVILSLEMGYCTIC